MGDRFSMSISGGGLLDELDFKPRPLELLLRRQYKFLFGIDTVQFSLCFIFYSYFSGGEDIGDEPFTSSVTLAFDLPPSETTSTDISSAPDDSHMALTTSVATNTSLDIEEVEMDD